MAWRVARDPGTASSRSGTEASVHLPQREKKPKKTPEVVGRDEEQSQPHKVRRVFHCAKSLFYVGEGQKVEMNPSGMLLYHLPSHVMGDIWVGVSERSFLFTGEDTAFGISNFMHSFFCFCSNYDLMRRVAKQKW